jgi:PleD family two-component response regulator
MKKSAIKNTTDNLTQLKSTNRGASQAIRTSDILKYYNVHRDQMTCVIRDRDMTLSSSERKKILFVDDDSDITTISKAALERNGFEVQTFGSSLSALENFKLVHTIC